ncbi:MAG: nuclear transport factor 2 family protein [Sphingobacteriaceae bacterium]|nr:MAG: nuclear transport factor 2 family protein [Sphingobacteriaceae bacterium]
MKTLKTIFLGLALLITANVVKADDKQKLTKDHAISAYIDAVAHGKLDGFNQVLDNDVKFSMMRGNTVLSYSKTEMLKSLNASKNTVQDCTVDTNTVESNGEVAIVKVDLQYQGFTRSNLVTVSNTGNGWKITNVHSVFK